jgi:dihydrofolate reductase
MVVITMVSLDGVMQSPGAKEEDASSGFTLGGWSMPYWDEVGLAVMDRQIGQPFDLLLGRKTYDIFAPYWPKQTGTIATAFNKATKYVVSDEAVDTNWDKTVRIHGDVVGSLRKLKAGEGPMLQVHGSGRLVQTLLAEDLVDELWLRTFPLTLGSGQRLWEDGVRPVAWKLTESVVTPKGVILASYERDGDVKTSEG